MPRPTVPMLCFLAVLAALLFATSATAQTPQSPPIAPPKAAPKAAPTVPCTVVRSMPHDDAAFTQGLIFDHGVFYESTGLYRMSDVRRVEPDTGRVLAATPLPGDRFGEGLALMDGQLAQLTWKAGEARFFDPAGLVQTGIASYQGQGWGLAAMGQGMAMSDGSSYIRFIKPDFTLLYAVRVTDAGRPVHLLNELEFVDGLILANVLGLDRIAAINPATGRVEFWVDCSELHPRTQRKNRENVLNGIAWDPDERRLFVTGKRWPKMYEIKVPGIN